MNSFYRDGFINEEFMPFIPLHDRFSAPANYQLTEFELQAAIASAYGDGYLHMPNKDSKYPRLVWNMGKNYEHAKYKKDFFSHIGTTIETKENPGFGAEWNCVKTSCHPCFLPVYDSVFKDGKKTVSMDSISKFGDIGWAWFYGDDGHLGSNSLEVYFHTEGYLEEGSIIFCNAFNLYMGYECAKVFKYIGGNPKKERYCVKVNGSGSDEFIKRVKPYMANGLEYKTIISQIKRRPR